MRRLVFPSLAALAAAGTITACGSSSSSSEIRTTFSSYENAIAAREGGAACRLVTSEMSSQMAVNARDAGLGESCADYIAKRSSRANLKRTSVAITKITVSGDHATARLRIRFRPVGGGRTMTSNDFHASFVRTDGRWLVGETRAPIPPKAHPPVIGPTLASQITKRFATTHSAKPAPH